MTEAKLERLQKILAAAGIASRRKAEELIAAGRVSVNGHTITEPGTKADPRLDEIRVDGALLRGPERHVYLAMYKPKGTMTTVSDPEGRPTVMDLLKGVEERVFPVGRLDYMSEGLLLLTNDGDLMAQLTRAGSHVAKTYMVKVSGKPSEEALEKLRSGILLPPEPGLTGARGKRQPGVERRSFAVVTRPAAIELAVDQENPWFEVTLTEGRNRQLRRMFEQIGHHIEKIKRIRYGSLTLDLEPGQFRYLTPKEVVLLRKSLEKPFQARPSAAKKTASGKPQRKPFRAERAPRLEAARFVQGRRGKPSAEAREGTSAKPPRPARPSAAREERPAARSFERPLPGGRKRPRGERPRGPEFTREGRGAGRTGTGKEEARRPAKRFAGAERGAKREGGFGGDRRVKREGGFAAKRKPRPAGAGREEGFAAKPRAWGSSSPGSGGARKFSKGPGKPRGEKRSGGGGKRGAAAPLKGGRPQRSGSEGPRGKQAPDRGRPQRGSRSSRRSPGQR